MDDDTTYATYQRALAPYRDAYMAALDAAWVEYLARTGPALGDYQRARDQLRRTYGLPEWPIGPIRD